MPSKSGFAPPSNHFSNIASWSSQWVPLMFFFFFRKNQLMQAKMVHLDHMENEMKTMWVHLDAAQALAAVFILIKVSLISTGLALITILFLGFLRQIEAVWALCAWDCGKPAGAAQAAGEPLDISAGWTHGSSEQGSDPRSESPLAAATQCPASAREPSGPNGTGR